ASSNGAIACFATGPLLWRRYLPRHPRRSIDKSLASCSLALAASAPGMLRPGPHGRWFACFAMRSIAARRRTRSYSDRLRRRVAPAGGHLRYNSRMKPLVGIIMGSKSDWDTLQPAADTLKRLRVPHEIRVVSAHRTPDLLFE